MGKKLTLQFCGGAGSVTGANFLLSSEEKKILVDCGLEQGSQMAETTNWEKFTYDASQIDTLLITHAHIDHVGLIPKLFYEGFKGNIISTPATKDIARLMLADTASILSGSESGKKFNLKHIYSDAILNQVFSNWETVPYHQKHDIGAGFNIFLKDAGHVLGSCMYEIFYNEKKIVFTGDLGNSPSPLLADTEDLGNADYVVMESVYGDRNHEGRKERRENLKNIILENAKNKGNLVVPIFSLERTQEFIYEMNELAESGQIPTMPIFIDSPLAIKVTEVFYKYKDLFRENVREDIKSGDDIFKFKGLKITKTSGESKAIVDAPEPKIIMAGSGMSSGGRVVHHEKNYLGDPNSTILITGFQTPGTPGRLLLDGAKKIPIFHQYIDVKAKVKFIRGYSGHKDSDGLLDFVSKIKDTKKIFLAMGEPRAAMFLAQKIKDNLDLKVSVPEKNEIVELDF